MSGFDALAIDNALENQPDLTGPAAVVADQLRAAPDEYQAGVRNLEVQNRAIDANVELSAEGKATRRAEAAAAWDADARALIDEAQTVADRGITTRQSRVQLPALHADPVLAEVRLGNARTDAQTALDRVQPLELLDVMRGLVESGSPELRHLLMSEYWPALYFRSRGAPGLSADWEEIRQEHLPALLSPDGKKALAELRALEPLVGIPANLRGIHDTNRARYGVR